MTKLEEIRKSLEEFILKVSPSSFLEGTVKSVDSDKYLVDVELESDLVLFDCRLRSAVTSSKSIDALPAVGSQVLLARLAPDDYVVLACDEIEEYRVTVGETAYKIDAQGHQIGKGNETLKKILNDLVDGVLKVYAPKDVAGLTAIKQRINTLLQ